MAKKEIHMHVVHKLARYGCFSVSLVYIFVGVLAILSFMGIAQPDADEARMIDLLLQNKLGKVLVWVMMAGLAGYIVWRIFEAITDPYCFGNNLKGVVHRLGVAASGLGYGFILYAAVELILGKGGEGEQERQIFIGQVLAWDGGKWLVGMAGAVLAITGLVQFRYAWSNGYSMCLDVDRMSAAGRKTVHALAWAGYFARGIILMVLGYFFFKAALQHDPEEVGDTDSAFDFIGGGGTLAGDIAFNAVAIGTICYGIFMLVNSIYYKFEKK